MSRWRGNIMTANITSNPSPRSSSSLRTPKTSKKRQDASPKASYQAPSQSLIRNQFHPIIRVRIKLFRYNQLEKVCCQKLTKIPQGHLEIFLGHQAMLRTAS